VGIGLVVAAVAVRTPAAPPAPVSRPDLPPVPGPPDRADAADYPVAMTRYPIRRAVSAGGVLVDDRSDARHVVLISRRSATGELQWTLPKGGLENGEDLAAAAVREVREETGFAGEIVDELGVIDYWFVWRPDGVRYHKFVHYFLMRVAEPIPFPRDDEAEDVEWLPLDEAVRRLTHSNERALLEGVRDRALPGAGR
jgi:8-oxo-dGTP pyrophosphatase MutT (NUDIX family)